MADEAMAHGLARGMMIAARGALARCEVVQYDQIEEGRYDGLFLMHDNVLEAMPGNVGHLPKWLWVHNPGLTSPLSLRSRAYREYQRVFHAGRAIADKCGLDHLPHAIESLDDFLPSADGDLYDVGFVGNAALHASLAPLFARLVRAGLRTEVRGSRWDELSVLSAGPVSMFEAGGVLARSKVCLDHVSDPHMNEGMTSTRIYQVLACDSALVSLQRPESVPEQMRPHVVFVANVDEAFRAVVKLAGDPVGRARLSKGARRSVLGETMLERAKVVWARILADAR